MYGGLAKSERKWCDHEARLETVSVPLPITPPPAPAEVSEVSVIVGAQQESRKAGRKDVVRGEEESKGRSRDPVETKQEGAPKICKALMQGISYQARNVYKSIMGHLSLHIKKNRVEMLGVLQAGGFTIPEIEHAFFTIDSYYDEHKAKRGNNRPQLAVDGMLAKKSIYTLMLRETLASMLSTWEAGRVGKVGLNNLPSYKRACERIYHRAVQLLAQEPISSPLSV